MRFPRLWSSLTNSPRLLCASAGLVVTLAVLASGLGEMVDLQMVNYLFKHVGTRFTPSSDVVLLVVDDASLQLMQDRVGRWPWPRSCLAQLVGACQGASGVGVDILLCENDRMHPEGDLELVRALRQHGRVALAGAFVDDLLKGPSPGSLPGLRRSMVPAPAELRDLPIRHLLRQFMIPATVFAEAASRMGHVNFYPARDHILRAYPYLENTDGGLVPSLAVAALMADPNRNELRRMADPPGWLRKASRPLELIYYRQSFVRYSAVDVLAPSRPRLPADWASGKVVLIGVEGKGLYDLRATPLDGDRSGLEIHATALSNWLQRTWLGSLPWAGTWLLAGLFGLFPVLFWDTRLLRLLGRWGLLLVGYGVAVGLAFHYVPLRLPCTAPVLAFLAAAFGRLAHMVRRERSLRRHLEELQQMRQMLNNMLLHDLNAPLSSMVMLVESVLPAQTAGTKGRQRLEGALAEGARLSGMLRTLLDIQRMESGRIQLALSSFSWNRLVAETAERLTQRAAQQSLQIEVTFCEADSSSQVQQEDPEEQREDGRDGSPCSEQSRRAIRPLLSTDASERRPCQFSHQPEMHPCPIEIYADANLLGRVLMNLLDNAIQHATAGTVIVCKTLLNQPGKERLTCRVMNRGPVLSPADQKRIFEPFVQIQGPQAASKRRGFGLGLAFCKLAIFAHGGTLWCKSPIPEWEGGVSMEFSIPLKPRERKPSVSAPA